MIGERLTSADDEDWCRAVAHRVDVLRGLQEILLAGEGLRYDGPRPPQSGSGDEKVILQLARGLAIPLGDEGCLGLEVDFAHAALDKMDVWSLQDLDVLEFHPRLLRVLLNRQRQG